MKLKLSKSQAWPIASLVFPDYRGRKFRIVFSETITFHDTNWGDGTRNQYSAVRSDGRTSDLNVPAPWRNPVEGATIPIPVDVIIVEHSIFCGTDVGITLHAHPSNLPKWLPESTMGAVNTLKEP